MKAILERPDVIQILCEHFGSDFDESNITIQTDPFQIEIRNIPVPSSEKPTTPAVRQVPRAETVRPPPEPQPVTREEDAALIAKRADGNATLEPPPPGDDEHEGIDVSGSPAAILEQSRSLEAQLTHEKGPPQRRGGSARAPKNFEEELG